jgi:HAMP domain-containing protein
VGTSPLAPGARELLAVAPIRAPGARRPAGVVVLALDFSHLTMRLERSPRHLTFLANDRGELLLYPRDVMGDAGDRTPRVQQVPPLLAAWSKASRAPAADRGRAADPGTRLQQERLLQDLGEPIQDARFGNVFIQPIRVNGMAPGKTMPGPTRSALQQWLQGLQVEYKDRLRATPDVFPDTKYVYVRTGDPLLLDEVRGRLRRHRQLQAQVTLRPPVEGRLNYYLRFHTLHFDPDRPGRFLAIASGASEEEIKNDIKEDQAAITGWAFAVVAAAVAVVSMSLFLITRPLSRITRAAEGFARGHFNVSLPTRSRDEIGVLARAFEAMIGQVRARTEALEEGATRTQAILDMAAEGIITIDKPGAHRDLQSGGRADPRLLGRRGARPACRDPPARRAGPDAARHPGPPPGAGPAGPRRRR